MTKRKLFPFIALIIILCVGCSNKNKAPGTGIADNTITPSGNQVMITESAASASPTLSPSATLTTTPTPTVTPPADITAAPTTATPEQNNETTGSKQIEALLRQMTLEEKVGQMFFVRCRNGKALTDIQDYHLGGYILFANDFTDQTKESMSKLIESYQKEAATPMLIGVDEEGGVVNRISKFPAFRSVPFQSPQALYQKGGFSLIKSDTKEKAQLLKNLGINVNLAPVCDVSTNPTDFIYTRSFGKDASQTAAYVKAVVDQMNSQGIGCTLKHFPGYGNNIDTHIGIAIDKRSYASFVKSDFIPFQAGIDEGAGSILVSHNIVISMDQKYPASLSAKVHTILREDLGFEGVIMTDDLSMDAIKDYTTQEEAAVLAINSGNDLVIADDFNLQIPAVVAAVRNGKIRADRIDESVRRILSWKHALGLI